MARCPHRLSPVPKAWERGHLGRIRSGLEARAPRLRTDTDRVGRGRVALRFGLAQGCRFALDGCGGPTCRAAHLAAVAAAQRHLEPAAGGAALRQRPVPRGEAARGVVAAAVEGAATPGAPLDHVAAALRAGNADLVE